MNRIDKNGKSGTKSAHQKREEIREMKDKIEQKKQVLQELLFQIVALRTLIQRNQSKENKRKKQTDKIMKFPFILLTTPDTPYNEVRILLLTARLMSTSVKAIPLSTWP